MNRALVTGANGFLGRALVRKLSEMQVETVAVIKEKGNYEKLPFVDYVLCPPNEVLNLQYLIGKKGFDCLFHFAWTGSAGPLRADYTEQIKNIENTCNTVKAAAKIGCKRIIFASSIMEYECQISMEAGVIPPISNIYSIGKLSAHLMGELLSKSYEIDFCPVIISNVFGEGENSPRLINSTIKKILNHEVPDFTEGTQMYDFIYIRDAVAAFIKIAELGTPFKQYYLGSQNPKPLRAFLEELGECFEPKAQMRFGAIPFNGVSVNYYETFDIHAVKNDTGFVPIYTFQQGIKHTIDSIRKEMRQ